MVLLFFCCGTAVHAQTQATEVQAHFERARDALARHDLERASEEYAEILKLDPRNAQVYAAQGVTLYGMGNPAEALASLKTALSLDPTQTNAEIFLGLSEADLGRCNEAVPILRKHFEERTEQKLRRLVGLSLLNCYTTPADLEQAVDLALSLKKSNPGDPDVLYNLAEVYSRLLNATVDELLKKHPESFRVHELAGESLEAQGQNGQAIKEYRKALEINPKVPRVHYRIGRLMLADGGGGAAEQEALAHFQQELGVNPGDAASEYQIGEILRKNHDYEKARRHFRRALELAPDFVEPSIGLAKLDLAEHQGEKAIANLEQVIRREPGNTAAHYALMLAYRDQDRTEEAKRELAIFQKLEAENAKESNSQLRSLLTGRSGSEERAR